MILYDANLTLRTTTFNNNPPPFEPSRLVSDPPVDFFVVVLGLGDELRE